MIKLYIYLNGFNGLISLYLTSFILVVCSVLLWVFFIVGFRFIYSAGVGVVSHYISYKQNNFVELAGIWAPLVILVILAYLGFKCLITMEPYKYPDLSVKATGYQWYWKYEVRDLGIDYEFESRLKLNKYEEGDLQDSLDWWILGVDYGFDLPVNEKIQVVVRRGDVVHSWAVPKLGIKIDGIPGMSNCFPMTMLESGIYTGICSELCGANHSQMPIFLEVL